MKSLNESLAYRAVFSLIAVGKRNEEEKRLFADCADCAD